MMSLDPESKSELAVKTENLSKNFNGLRAVSNLNLNISKGEIFGLVGPDGAGKTTTLRMLSGVLKPSAGQAWLLGFNLAQETEKIKENIAYLTQRFSLYKDLTVNENINFIAKAHKVSEKDYQDRKNKFLDITGLAPFANRLVEHLSGGMRQKLALSAALIHRPELLLLDEPTTGVDPVARRDFWKILMELNQGGSTAGNGITLLIATPYMDEAERCHRVGLMFQGQLLTQESPNQLKSFFSSQHQIFEISSGSTASIGESLKDARKVLIRFSDVESTVLFGSTLHLILKENSSIQKEDIFNTLKKEGFSDFSINPIQPSLEDIFVSKLSS